jgi:hypothetical protein
MLLLSSGLLYFLCTKFQHKLPELFNFVFECGHTRIFYIVCFMTLTHCALKINLRKFTNKSMSS